MSVEDLFLAAVEIDAPAQRAAYLDSACGGDADLRAQVEALLRAHAQAGSLLEQPLFRTAPAAAGGSPTPERPGAVLGRYTLVEQLGEGGMGTVFLAQQSHPVQRQVALKLIKAGMDSRQVIARFEQERQALALMDHPHIAKVFDAGATASGRPYFVMEQVQGVPITTYCDQHRLPLRERLGLLVAVCQAVQHAHQKGIIHRDLKPSNVLVASYDGRAVPKVIDFGIAKATGPALTGSTGLTEVGTVVGTLEYMSPEQARLDALDIDTRTDIYSLGVLLYELLTGTTPLERRQLKEVSLLEALQRIREEESPTPSSRLSTVAELPTIASNRGVEPRRLSGLVRGELDWIVMKCLEKDRNRRYETASGLARDIERYLHNEPVQACPASAWYRFRKFARRNQAALAVSGLLLAFLLTLAAAIGWAVLDRKARRSRSAGEVAQMLSRAESFYRNGKWTEALAEARKAHALLEASDGPEESRREVQEWLTDLNMVVALQGLRFDAVDRKVGAMHSSGAAWAFRTDPDKTEADYARLFREYGIDMDALSPEAAAARICARRIRADLVVGLDEWAWRLGGWKKYKSRERQLIATAGAANANPWRARLRLATALLDRQALRELAATADVPTLPTATIELLANALVFMEDRETAVSLLRTVWQQRPDDFRVNFFLGLYLSPSRDEEQLKGRQDAALPFLTAAVAINPRSRMAHFVLGRALLWSGATDDAIPAFQKAIRLMPDPPIEDDLVAAGCAYDLLAVAWRRKGDEDKAASAWRQRVRLAVAAAKEAIAQPKDRDLWECWEALGTEHYYAGDWNDAAAALETSIQLRQPGDCPGSFILAMTYWQLGRKEEARSHYDRLVRWMETNPPLEAGEGRLVARGLRLRFQKFEAEKVLGAPNMSP